MNYQQVIAVLVVVVGLVGTIQAGCLGGPCKQEQVEDCRKQLKHVLTDLKWPAVLLKVLKNIEGTEDPHLKTLTNSVLVRKHFNAEDYLDQLSASEGSELFYAASAFVESALKLRAKARCAKEDLLKVTDIKGRGYFEYINGNAIIDEFNSLTYLAKAIATGTTSLAPETSH